MKEADLRGIFVPVVTPFSSDEELDEASFERYLAHLLSYDIQGVVINGTTGESPTVAWEEVGRLVRRAQAIMAARKKRIPLIVGTGTNDTRTTVRRTEIAGQWGADAALVVVPYYSRPSQAGIVEHFRRTSRTGLPVIAYEIPARTGVNLTLSSAAEILEMDGVIGMKDSSGGTELISALAHLTSKPVLCGEDALFHTMLSQGAAGGFLASANVLTNKFIEVFSRHRSGETERSKRAFDSLAPLIRLLFEDSNPAPLKHLLTDRGLIASDTLRAPLRPVSSELKAELEQAWRDINAAGKQTENGTD
nr:4-hydroxy-tetrahydrodipicolinate synthase [Paenibacillus sacheonensis]